MLHILYHLITLKNLKRPHNCKLRCINLTEFDNHRISDLHFLIVFVWEVLMNAPITTTRELFIKSNDSGHLLLHDNIPEFLESLLHSVAVCCDYKAESLISLDFIEWCLDEACINDVRVLHLAPAIIIVSVACNVL